MSMIVQLGYGKANFATVRATYAAMRVVAPFVRASAATTGRRVGSFTKVLAGSIDDFGAILQCSVEHDPGTVILLQVSRTRNNVPISEGALFLRLRSGAAHYRIEGKVPTPAQNRCGDRVMIFSGNADFMTPEELEQECGIQVNRGYISRFMSAEELEESFNIVQVSPEISPRSVVQTVMGEQGEVKTSMGSMPVRRLRLRSGG